MLYAAPTLDDADAIALHQEPLSADTATRDAMAGYRDAMTYVLRLANDADFGYSTDLLRGLHFMLTNHDLGARPGQWRAGSVYVRAEMVGARLLRPVGAGRGRVYQPDGEVVRVRRLVVDQRRQDPDPDLFSQR